MRILFSFFLLLSIIACEQVNNTESIIVFQGPKKQRGTYTIRSLDQDTLFLANGKCYYHLQLRYGNKNNPEQCVLSSTQSFLETNRKMELFPVKNWISKIGYEDYNWNSLRNGQIIELEGQAKKHRVYLRYLLNE